MPSSAPDSASAPPSAPPSSAAARPLLRPAWLPSEEELQAYPPAVRAAVDAVLLPMWGEAALHAQTAVERSAGEALAYYAWLEIVQQAELSRQVAAAASTQSGVDVDPILNRLLRTSRFKLAAGGFLMRVHKTWRAFDRRRELQALELRIEDRLEELHEANAQQRTLIEQHRRASKAAKKAQEPRLESSAAAPPASVSPASSVCPPPRASKPEPNQHPQTAPFPSANSLPAIDLTLAFERSALPDARAIFAAESARVISAGRQLEKGEPGSQRTPGPPASFSRGSVPSANGKAKT